MMFPINQFRLGIVNLTGIMNDLIVERVRVPMCEDHLEISNLTRPKSGSIVQGS